MQTKQNITPRNEKGRPHGYWEIYYGNGQLSYKGNYINGIHDGYWEAYYADGKLMFKGIFNYHKKIGLWFQNGEKIFYAN